jgi:glyceraldehyde-3-phosphate dehydrogenase (NADP+)
VSASVPAGRREPRLKVLDPEDGKLVGELAETSRSELDAVLARGEGALRTIRLPAHERARILSSVADRVAACAAEHEQLIATEGIKTLREARREVMRCVETLRLAAAEAKRLGGSVLQFDQFPTGVGRTGFWTLKPAGLVVALTPFNDPLNLVAHKLAPAFALGAPTVVKPHPQTPFSALRLVEHFRAAGAPEAMVQIVIGGADLGEAMVVDPRVRIVSFTGGLVAGTAIAARAGLKKLLLELGGVAIVAVAADANLDHAARAIHAGAFWAAGQNCIHSQRIIVDERVIDELRERLVELARGMRLGSKRDETTDMGTLVDGQAARRAQGFVDYARSLGGRVLTGGTHEGSRYAPTWIDRLPEANDLVGSEIFAPISTLETAAGLEDILRRLTGATAAIHTAIFTSALDTVLATYETANCAALIVNDSTDFRIDAMPFGGVGSAGLGREGVVDAIEAMAEKKMLVLNRPV